MSHDVTGAAPAPTANDESQPKRQPPVANKRVARRQVPGFVLSWGMFVILIGLWELAIRVFDVPTILVPAPSKVALSLVHNVQTGYLFKQAWVTLKEILIGFGLAVGLGLASAVLVTQFRLVEKALFPMLVLIQTIPKVAMAPLLVIWFGLGLPSKVWTIALIAYFPLLINAILGLRSAEPEQIAMLKSFGATKWQIMRRLRLPLALPHIFAGLDVAVILSVTGAIVAEFVGSSAGLGYAIQATNFNLDVATTFAVVVLLSVIGMTLQAIVVLLSNWLVFWSPTQKAGTRDL